MAALESARERRDEQVLAGSSGSDLLLHIARDTKDMR